MNIVTSYETHDHFHIIAGEHEFVLQNKDGQWLLTHGEKVYSISSPRKMSWQQALMSALDLVEQLTDFQSAP